MESDGTRYRPPLKLLYAKKAGWVERFALALFAALVLGQVAQGVAFTQPSVLLGAIMK